MDFKYKAILNVSWPRNTGEPRMDMNDRAIQFAPFAALTGYEDVIGEAGRLTENPVFLTEESLQRLNEALRDIQRNLADRPVVKLTVYEEDPQKEGGAFREYTGPVKKMDLYEGTLTLEEGRKIPFSGIVEIEKMVDCKMKLDT